MHFNPNFKPFDFTETNYAETSYSGTSEEGVPTASVPNTLEEKTLTDADTRRIIMQGIDPKNNELSLQELQDLATKFESYKKDANRQKELGNTNSEHVYIDDQFGPFEFKCHKLEIFVRYLVINNIIHAYDRRGTHLCLYLTPDAPLHYIPGSLFEQHSKITYFDRSRLLAVVASMEEKALSIPSIDEFPERAQKSMKKILLAIRATHWNTSIESRNLMDSSPLLPYPGAKIFIQQHSKNYKKSDGLNTPLMRSHGEKAIMARKHHWYKLGQNYKTIYAHIDDSLSGDQIDPYLDDLVERGTIHSWERKEGQPIELLVQKAPHQPISSTMRDKIIITREKEFREYNWLDREKILSLFSLGEVESKSLSDLINQANLRLKHGPVQWHYCSDSGFIEVLDKLVEEGFIHSYKIGYEMLPGNLRPLRVFVKEADYVG